MNQRSLMDLVNKVSEENLTIDAILRLGPYIDDANVLDALCREAIETDDHLIREALIKTLKGNPEETNRRFAKIACDAKDPAHRRWALINLSLMECRNAEEAVMQGLRDPHRSVRIAAAFNAGLYCDNDIVNALELFFERDRTLFLLDGLRDAVRALLPLMKKLAGQYSEYYHHDRPGSRRGQNAQNENVNKISGAEDKQDAFSLS